MAIIPFGEYLPDLPALGNPGATVAKNVIPHLAGYKPLSSLVTFSGALTARCQGAFSAIDTAGVTNVYAGDATSLYRLTAGPTPRNRAPIPFRPIRPGTSCAGTTMFSPPT